MWYLNEPAASAWAPTASDGAPSETHGVHLRVHAILGKKSQEHTVNRESVCGNWHRRRLLSFGLSTDHRLLKLPKSYEPGHTHGSHACDLSIRYSMPWEVRMKLSFFDVHGHMHTGVLWVICVLWNCLNPYVYPTDSVRSHEALGESTGPVGAKPV